LGGSSRAKEDARKELKKDSGGYIGRVGFGGILEAPWVGEEGSTKEGNMVGLKSRRGNGIKTKKFGIMGEKSRGVWQVETGGGDNG